MQFEMKREARKGAALKGAVSADWSVSLKMCMLQISVLFYEESGGESEKPVNLDKTHED